MKQIGTVVEINGEIARVECNRQSACDMCENAANCAEKCKVVYATAVNEANACIGDTVEIETDTAGVLKNAFTVFILPIVIAVLSYFAADFFFSESVAVIVTFVVLVFSMFALSFLLNMFAKKRVVSKVVKILFSDFVKK